MISDPNLIQLPKLLVLIVVHGFTTVAGAISAFPPESWTYSGLGMEPHSGGRCLIFMGSEVNKIQEGPMEPIVI